MRAVSARAIELLKAACLREGIPFEEVASGLVLGRARAAEWASFAEALVRLRARLAREEALHDLGARLFELEPAASLRTMARALPAAEQLFRAFACWLLPSAIGPLRGRFEALDARRLRVLLELAPDVDGSRELLEIVAGAARTLPRLIGLADASVAARIDARRAELVIEPPARSGLARLGLSPDAREASPAVSALLDAAIAQAEALQRRAHSRERALQALVRACERLGDGVLVVEEGRVVDVSAAFAARFGAPREAFRGRALVDLASPAQAGALTALLGAAASRGGSSRRLDAPVSVEWIGTDGKLLPLQVVAVESLEDDAPCVVLVVRARVLVADAGGAAKGAADEASRAEGSFERAAPAKAAAPRRRVGVLVADDDALIRAAVRRTLVRAGYAVREARDGVEALELVRRSEASRGAAGGEPTVELVLTDVRMPRLDGFSLAEILREIAPALPVVFMSGFADVLYEPSAIPRGQLLPKPFSPSALLGLVRSVLQADASADSA